MPGELDHIGKAIEASAEVLVADVVAYVKGHPQYGAIVQALGEKAIAALAAGL